MQNHPESGSGLAEITVRFFVRREQQPWGAEEVEKYSDEEIMQWDVN